MIIKRLFFSTSILFFSLSSSSQSAYSLFNGRDLSGWHTDVPEMDTNKQALNPFIVRNGRLVSMGVPNGHLITDSIYHDYRIQIEYRFAGKPGNCGLLVHHLAFY